MRKISALVAGALVPIVLMNLARIDRTNPPEDATETIASRTCMPAPVTAIFRRACQNCHSERTDWPWYSAVAPFHWLMTADVYAARQRLNLSTWGRYNEARRTDSLIAICETVASDKMPLWYYKPAHYPSAWLSESDKKEVCDWTKAEVQRLARAQNVSSEEKETAKWGNSDAQSLLRQVVPAADRRYCDDVH